MLDHLSISVKDYPASLNFYDKTFEALGYSRIVTIDMPEHGIKTAGYGQSPKPSFWISPMGREDEAVGKAKGMHMAFSAPSQEAVDTWYTLALSMGATDNGKPGPRPEYHPGYYGAFVVDPNGWRIESCIHHYQSNS